MTQDDQEHRPQDLEDHRLDVEANDEDALDDEDLEEVAGGWSGNDDGGG